MKIRALGYIPITQFTHEVQADGLEGLPNLRPGDVIDIPPLGVRTLRQLGCAIEVVEHDNKRMDAANVERK